MNRRMIWFIYAGTLLAIVLLIGLGGMLLLGRAYNQNYADRIYPGVSVQEIDLGGLTAEEATNLLETSLPAPDTLSLTLRDGERTWQRTWADLGIRIDTAATARMAYQVGRQGTPEERRAVQLKALTRGHSIPPIVVLPDSSQVASVLQELAPEIADPPTNAALIIGPKGITPVPAQAGRELDIDATIAAMPHALRIGPHGMTMDLLTRQVVPAIGNPGPAQAQAEALLAQPLTLSVHDPLTDYQATWAIEPPTIAEWLSARPVEDDQGARLELTIDEEKIHAYLNQLNDQLGSSEVAIDVANTAPAIRDALQAGETQASATLFHPATIYRVQLGDTLMSIAQAHGFPVWRLVEANPALDADNLHPGQEITIPSLDILLPLPLITERRIVIDISEQRLYAYEGETVVYDYVSSTGIESSPTIPGTFQILSKEEIAYASNWDLWMPHFIGIYRSGPDFTNGIHGLPTLSSGRVLWEGHLGRPVSYGCIVIGLNEAATLYNWAELGTLVIIQE